MDAKANEFFDIIAAGLPLQHQHSLRNACRCVEHPAHATLLNTYLLFTQGKCSYDKAMHRIMKEVVEISLQKCFSIYNELFAELSTERGKILAKTESGTGNTASALTYGEIDFFSLIDILERAGVEEGSTYVDLGHGTGKGLIAPALVFGDRLRVAYGIEILNSLHVESIRVTDKFKGILREDEQLQISHSRCEILVEEGDILTDSQIFDWTKADVVFVNSTCFDEALMDRISTKANAMRPGTRFLSLTRPLTSKEFHIVDKLQYTMSWGTATCYFHIRNAN